MLQFIEKAKKTLKNVEQNYSAIQVAPPDSSLDNNVSPTLCEIEDYVTQEADVDPNELRCRIEDMTTSCRSTLGHSSTVLTTTVLNDAFKLLHTGRIYSQLAVRMNDLEQTGVAIEKQIVQAGEYKRRLEAVRAIRIQLQELLNKPLEQTESRDQEIGLLNGATETTVSEHSDAPMAIEADSSETIAQNASIIAANTDEARLTTPPSQMQK